jgi:hypothetical protein
MAAQNLIVCPDCDKQVSRNAESCPNCGRPINRRQTAGGLLSAVIIGLILCWGDRYVRGSLPKTTVITFQLRLLIQNHVLSGSQMNRKRITGVRK